MNQRRKRSTILGAALLVASLAAPAAAAERAQPAGGPGGWWANARQALALALGGWLGPLGGWNTAWGEEGNGIDPDGLRATPAPPTSPAGAALDEGHGIDPDGKS